MAQVRRSSAPALLNVALYLLLAAMLAVIILVRTGGHFTYCLDDPYIHLALAERIRHGLYGLNTGEAASPSSSIVWPLLFVPFANTAVMPWLPLFLNVCCGAATAWLIGVFAAGCFGEAPTGHRSSMLLVGPLLVLGLNLPGLTFTGLEHSLQVLLCVACALAAAQIMRGNRMPGWGLAAAVLLPSVRYEGLLITVALALVLIGVRAWRAATGIVLGSALVPAAFSLYLHRLSLPWFPLSVLVKSSYKFADQSSLPVRTVRMIAQTLKQSLFDLERLPQLLIAVALATLAWKHRRTRGLLWTLGGAAFVGAVQVVLGPVGWFYRYEIYALAFTTLVLIAAVALPAASTMTKSDRRASSNTALDVIGPTPQTTAGQPHAHTMHAVLAGVTALALIYAKPLLSVPRAALGIYEQQFQLGRLMGEFYHEPVAVNDLGWVAFGRTPQQYTLDLYGLGSYEAFRTKEKDRTPAWLDTITREHHVGLVAIYPEWFKQGVPQSWTAVAKLCAADVNTQLGPVSQRVMLYRTPSAARNTVENAIEHWRGSLPSTVSVQLQPKDDSNLCGG